LKGIEKMKRLIVLIVAPLFFTGCHMMLSTPSGVREFYRGQNGLVVTGKSAANVADEYHITQRETDMTGVEKLKAQLEQMRGGQ
jgi:PBP1b-binding outer membrane lipoprotein LpoB